MVKERIVAAELGVPSGPEKSGCPPPLNGLYASGVVRLIAAWKSVLETALCVVSSVLAAEAEPADSQLHPRHVPRRPASSRTVSSATE